jgi:predicted O-linked N-acetylglucosamine transferase (SPINDLY family)
MCCFQAPGDAPDVGTLPALECGHLTFGSLHNLFKLNAFIFELWSKILHATPNSRLLLFRDMMTDVSREHIRRHFKEHGISEERLDLRKGSSAPGYLGIFNEIDVSLDAFPCTGGVTTCESLWMGVPVITLCGDRPASRNSAALLARAGLSDWIAQTSEQYVNLAAALPNDLDKLAQLRAELRKRVAETLCDARRFTQSLEEAYRQMWQQAGADTRRGG